MREVVFALQFKGTAAPVEGDANRLRARTSAGDQTLRTTMKADGIQAAIEGSGAATITFESDVEIVGEGAFVESGSISYGAAGKITFKTVGRGTLGASPMPDVQRGAVIWEITGGDGRFRGAQGLITSNFTVGAKGDVVDDHFVRLYLPS